MPHADYQDMRTFYETEPWGLPAQDILNAHAISVLAEINRNVKKRITPYGVADFRLFSEPKPNLPEPTVEGKTAAQWKIIFGAERLAAARERDQ
jgi:hypothetical protein